MMYDEFSGNFIITQFVDLVEIHVSEGRYRHELGRKKKCFFFFELFFQKKFIFFYFLNLRNYKHIL